VSLPKQPVSEVSSHLLPWALGGFAIMFASGLFLFLSLLILAGANALFCSFQFHPHMSEWDQLPAPPRAVRLVGALSLLLWIGVVAAGRNMGYRFLPREREWESLWQ
jgi:hypothetical protein